MKQPKAEFTWHQCSPYQAVTGKIYCLKQHFLVTLCSCLKVTKIKKVVLKHASCHPSRSSQEKEVNRVKQKIYTAILSDYWYLSKYCRLTYFCGLLSQL